jgi:hypothetical protein
MLDITETRFLTTDDTDNTDESDELTTLFPPICAICDIRGLGIRYSQHCERSSADFADWISFCAIG